MSGNTIIYFYGFDEGIIKRPFSKTVDLSRFPGLITKLARGVIYTPRPGNIIALNCIAGMGNMRQNFEHYF